MLVMFHGYFHADLWKIFAKLKYFYRQICAKHVSKVMMQKLEKKIMVLVCKKEKIFPSGWFNVMKYMLVHYLRKLRLEDLRSSGGCIVKKEN
jgi:hypothetical protein